MEVNNDFLRAIKNGLKVFDEKKKLVRCKYICANLLQQIP